jgi:hypothetical protein
MRPSREERGKCQRKYMRICCDMMIFDFLMSDFAAVDSGIKIIFHLKSY